MPNLLNTYLPLTVGQLFFLDAHKQLRRCAFQFNPTELERSRSIAITRTPTGNVLEEPKFGPRNQAKRKLTRKVEPWEMTLTLKFDASRPLDASDTPTPLPRGALWDPNDGAPTEAVTTSSDETGGFTDRIAHTLRFFEALAEPVPFTDEDDRIVNADETPPPPIITLALGPRSWNCFVKQVRIKEQDYTFDLHPRRFEVTVSFEIFHTIQQNENDHTGGRQ